MHHLKISYLFIFLGVMTSCLKSVDPPEFRTNVFDPIYDGPIWYEEVGIDSTQIVGSFYFYDLKFRLLNQDLIDRKQDYTLKIRKWNKQYFTTLYPSPSGEFNYDDLQTPERINGNFVFEIALYGEHDQKEISVKHESQW